MKPNRKPKTVKVLVQAEFPIRIDIKPLEKTPAQLKREAKEAEKKRIAAAAAEHEEQARKRTAKFLADLREEQRKPENRPVFGSV